MFYCLYPVLLFGSVTMADILLPSTQCDDDDVPNMSDGESISDGDVAHLTDVEEDPEEKEPPGIPNTVDAVIEQMHGRGRGGLVVPFLAPRRGGGGASNGGFNGGVTNCRQRPGKGRGRGTGPSRRPMGAHNTSPRLQVPPLE